MVEASPEDTTQTEGKHPISRYPLQDTPSQAFAAERTDWGDIVDDQPAEDNLDDAIQDEGGQLTPTDDLASPEYLYDLSYEFMDEQAERMMISPPRPSAEDNTSAAPSSDVQLPSHPATPAVEEHIPQPPVMELNYQLRPRGICLVELLLTQPYV